MTYLTSALAVPRLNMGVVIVFRSPTFETIVKVLVKAFRVVGHAALPFQQVTLVSSRRCLQLCHIRVFSSLLQFVVDNCIFDSGINSLGAQV